MIITADRPVWNMKPTNDTSFRIDADRGTYHVHGIKVNEEVFNLAKAMARERSFLGVRFGGYNPSDYGNNCLYVYFPEDTHCRGVIGYCDVGVSAQMVRYFVYSKHIDNLKIKSHKWQAHISASTSIARTVSVAKAKLRKLDDDKMIQLVAAGVHHHIQESFECKSNDADEAREELRSALGDGGSLTSELRHMLTSGYEFVNNDVRKMAQAYINELDSTREEGDRTVKIMLVVNDPVTNRASVWRSNRHFKANSTIMGRLAPSLEGEPEVCATDDLPEDVKANISTLLLLEHGEYVDGVGMRKGDNVFILVQDV